MYLQAIWEAEHDGSTLEDQMDEWAGFDQELRDESGPPADYDPTTSARSTSTTPRADVGPARQRLGDDKFWELVRRWPGATTTATRSYDEITSWWSEQTGEDLSRSSTLAPRRDDPAPGLSGRSSVTRPPGRNRSESAIACNSRPSRPGRP